MYRLLDGMHPNTNTTTHHNTHHNTLTYQVGLQADWKAFIYFVAVILIVINVGFSLSQVIAAVVPTTNMAISLYMLVLVYSLLLGGFIVSPSTLPAATQWLLYTSYFFFGFQGLCINEFEKKDYGPAVLKDLGMDGGNKYVALGVLVMYWVGLRVAALIALHFLHKEKR